jgi:hypothetical protein
MQGSKFEIITAFVDGERVGADELRQALADPEGREYLTDVVSLREAVRAADHSMTAAPPKSTSRGRWLAAAALVVIAGGTGYALGHRTSRTELASASVAPAPTRVIELKPGVNWQETGGGLR